MLNPYINIRAIPMKVVPQPPLKTRMIVVQTLTEIAAFEDDDVSAPDWACGCCGNILARKISAEAWHPVLGRELPPLREAIFSKTGISRGFVSHYISSEHLIIKCAGCGSFNETDSVAIKDVTITAKPVLSEARTAMVPLRRSA